MFVFNNTELLPSDDISRIYFLQSNLLSFSSTPPSHSHRSCTQKRKKRKEKQWIVNSRQHISKICTMIFIWSIDILLLYLALREHRNMVLCKMSASRFCSYAKISKGAKHNLVFFPVYPIFANWSFRQLIFSFLRPRRILKEYARTATIEADSKRNIYENTIFKLLCIGN